jgi:hypothetical protein
MSYCQSRDSQEESWYEQTIQLSETLGVKGHLLKK